MDLFEKYKIEILNLQAYFFNKYGVSISDAEALSIYLDEREKNER